MLKLRVKIVVDSVNWVCIEHFVEDEHFIILDNSNNEVENARRETYETPTEIID